MPTDPSLLANAPSMSDPSQTPAFDPFPLQDTALLGGGGPQFFLNADSRDAIASNGKPSDTIDEAASQIVRAAPGWSAALGQGFTVTYAFRADAPTPMPDDTGGFQEFSQGQIDQTLLALQAWSDVADIKFVRVGAGDTGAGAYSDNATILFANYTTGEDGAAAFGNFPGVLASAGDVWVNSTLSYNANPTTGNYGGQVLVHEIGHAIGLDHPSDYNAEANVTLTYANDASYYEDDRQYTVMSYFSELNTGANFGGNLYSAAPLLDDIAAAQLEYGPNMTTRTGDTVYGFNSNTGEPWYSITGSFQKTVFAVWDAGGTDTLDFSGYNQAGIIDLRAGFFSSVGGLTGNVTIAEGAVVENAIGGSGDDSITGNTASNSIQGGAGADTVMAGAGNDTISGGTGASYLRGEDGDDSVQGGAQFDDINGNKGADTIDGGTGGSDWLVGGQGNDLITAHASANNLLYGNLGDDTLHGGSGGDVLRGGQGDDSIVGGSGSDFVSGDRGNDTESGGAGADIFHTSQDAGIDKVLDFNLAEGDRVQVDPGTTFTVSQVGADTVIDMGGGNQMILVGVQMSTLTGGWIFGA
jgi:serralysin